MNLNLDELTTMVWYSYYLSKILNSSIVNDKNSWLREFYSLMIYLDL